MPGLGEAVLAVSDDILAFPGGVSTRSSGLCRGVAFGLVSFRVEERESLGVVGTMTRVSRVGMSESQSSETCSETRRLQTGREGQEVRSRKDRDWE